MTTDTKTSRKTKNGTGRALLARLLPFLLLAAAYGTIMREETSRMFWPFLLLNYVIAALVYIFSESRRPDAQNRPASLSGYLFAKKIWLHPSSIQDCVIFLTNYFILYKFIFDPLIMNPENAEKLFLTAYAVVSIPMEWLRIPRHEGPPGLFPLIAYTVYVLLQSELFYYFWHRATHTFPVLWEFHKVHHSAKVLTPLTYIRAHPFDMWPQHALRILSLGIASGIFYYLYPDIGGMIKIASIDAGLFIMYVIGGNLHHSHVWLGFGRIMEHIVFSPAQHQIHHSIDPRHYNRNFGSMLSVWDWLFGTLYIVKERENITFGLTDRDEKNLKTVKNLYIHPVKNLIRKIMK